MTGERQYQIDDATFLYNVREARENGYDRVCVECGVGVVDDSDMHEGGSSGILPRCSEYVEMVR